MAAMAAIRTKGDLNRALIRPIWLKAQKSAIVIARAARRLGLLVQLSRPSAPLS
jgi:hypothetical protein